MEGSTSNYSGSSVYPPSLNDTSISSASAGKSGWRSTQTHNNFIERKKPQYKFQNQYPNDYYRYQEKVDHMNSKYYSMDGPEIERSGDVVALSDPGVIRSEQGRDQNGLKVEYSQSEIALASSAYHESPRRVRRSPRYIQEERHLEARPQFSQNRYSSAHIGRNSISPPLEQQKGSYPWRQQNHSRDPRSTSQENSYVRANENYNDSKYMSSPSYNERSLDATSSTSAVNVKELKRQLWNNDEVLKVQAPPSPKYHRKIQQSLSPIRQPRWQRPIAPSNNLPRFARSLSPRRRQYQHSSDVFKDSPSPIQKASSTISETSYNNRFHSKFYEAALVAQKGTVDINKASESVTDDSLQQSQQYQQQNEHQSRFSSLRPLNESDPNLYHGNIRGNNSTLSPSLLHNSSTRMNNSGTHENAFKYYERNDSDTKVENSARRPPILPPSSFSPTATEKDEGDERHQLRQSISADRGRSKDTLHFRTIDGRSARRIRPPSPLLLERIRSYDHDYCYEPAQRTSEGQAHGYKSKADRHDGNLSNHNVRQINFHDNTNGNDVHDAFAGIHRYNMNEETVRKPYITSSTNDRFKIDGEDQPAGLVTTIGNERNMQKGSSIKQGGHQFEKLRDSADENGNDRMTNLVDKLSAVNRENPESALAQIDSILREETQTSNTKSIANRNGFGTKNDKIQICNDYRTEPSNASREIENGEEDETSNNEDDDESSDVSSITNPTFQQGISRSLYSRQIDPLYIRENDHYKMHNTTQNSNLERKSNDDVDNFQFNPLTSSFRRPRPTHLQNDSRETTKDPNTFSRSELKRQQLKQFPPPTTVKVKDDLVNHEDPRQHSADFREKMLQRNIVTSRAKKDDNDPRGPDIGRTIGDTPKKKVDRFITDKQNLAKKIRGWDELSNQISKTRSEQEGEKIDSRNTGVFSNGHPWDSNVNFVQTKDTSMDNAIGVEAEMSTRENRYKSNTNRYDAEADVEISIEGSEVKQRNHFEKARENIKNRTDNNPFNDHSVNSNEKSDILDSNDGISDETPNIEMPMMGIPQFNPSAHQQSIYTENAYNDNKADTDGKSWVGMPPSNFFPDINDDFEPLGSKTNQRKDRSHESSKQSEADEEFYQLPAGLNKIKIQNADEVTESLSIARLACKTMGKKEPKPKEKKRGFLRAFMEKKKARAPSGGYAASATAGSVSGHSNSVESRGVKSASQLHSNSMLNPTQAIPKANIRILPPPCGVLDEDFQNRTGHRSALKHRSTPSEKFRSSRMAKKFNRVMELYDSDEA